MSIPAGLAAGVLAWFVAGGPSSASIKLEPAQALVGALKVPRQRVGASRGVLADLASQPLFPLTTGPGAVVPPSLRLDGLVRSKARIAALLSINDKPAEWMGVGESRDGVTLEAVLPSKIVVDTVLGPQEVALGASVPSSQPAGLADAQSMGQQGPAGLRGPPPPANAPRPR